MVLKLSQKNKKKPGFLPTYSLIDFLVLALLATSDLALEVVVQVGQVLEKVFLVAVLVLVCRLLVPIGVSPEQ